MIDDGQIELPLATPAEASLPVATDLPPAAPAPAVQLARRERFVLSRDAQIVLALTALGLAIRLFYVLKAHPPAQSLYSDMQGAYSNARTFADPHHVSGPWDTVKPRAMGLLGAFLLRHFGMNHGGLLAWSVLQALLGTAAIPLSFVGMRRCFGRTAALLTAAYLTVDYLAIAFAGFLMVETYLAFFLTLSLALLDPKRPVLTFLSGIALGLGVWFKPQGFLLAPFWMLALWIFGGPQLNAAAGRVRRALAWLITPTRQRISALMLGVGLFLVIIPESVAISRINHRPTFLSAYGGQNFYIGHCHVKLMSMDGGPLGYFNAGVPKVYQRNEPWPDVTFRASVFENDVFMREGMKCFTQSFGFAVTWLLWQLADVFAGPPWSTIDTWPVPGGPLSGNRAFQLLIMYLYAPLAFVALWRGRRTLGPWIGFGAPMASIWTLAVVFSGDPRYRMPFDVFIVGGGSAGLLYVAQQWRHRLPILRVQILPKDPDRRT